jgi:hypothetical protein
LGLASDPLTDDDRIHLRQTLGDFQLCAEIAINSNPS